MNQILMSWESSHGRQLRITEGRDTPVAPVHVQAESQVSVQGGVLLRPIISALEFNVKSQLSQETHYGMGGGVQKEPKDFGLDVRPGKGWRDALWLPPHTPLGHLVHHGGLESHKHSARESLAA
jgi:hypothetical protein